MIETIYSDPDFLEHHGVKGMKWGVRRYQNYDGTRIRGDDRPEGYSYAKSGGYLKKGSHVTRIATTKEDKTYANKKHVSTNAKDEETWEKALGDKYIGDKYKDWGFDPHVVEYETTKDLKVASQNEIGMLFIEKMLSDPAVAEKSYSDIRDAYTTLEDHGWTVTEEYLKYPDLMATVSIAQQTETGKKFCDELLASGYDALADTHGLNTADDPIIILDPDHNLKRVSEKRYKGGKG